MKMSELFGQASNQALRHHVTERGNSPRNLARGSIAISAAVEWLSTRVCPKARTPRWDHDTVERTPPVELEAPQ